MIGADFSRDLAHASRSLFKNPDSTALLVLTLALGIGATSAIFSVVEGVVLRPLPYADVDRLGVIRVDALNREGLLFEVAPHDPATYAGVVGLLTVIVMIASALPAWRALRVDPARALRNEG